MLKLLVLSLPLALIACGCSSQTLPPDAAAALRQGTSFELFSLDPAEEAAIHDGTYEGEQFHGWAVLGSTMIDDAATRAQLLDALDQAVAANDPNVAVNCFWPRHGIRVIFGGQQHDLLICFQCKKFGWYVDGSSRTAIGIEDLCQPTFDEVLQDAGVPLPEK